jgi:phage tail sheath protein FI
VKIKGNTTVAVGLQTPVTSGTNVTLTTGTGYPTGTPTPTYAAPNSSISISAITGLAPGTVVTISGVTPAGYNGTWTAQTGTTTTSLVINTGANLGAITVAGNIVVNTSHNLKVGQTVDIPAGSGITPSNYAGTFVVTAVPTSSSFTVVNAKSPSGAITVAGSVTAQSATDELTLTAKSPGAWSNGLYYDISSSTSNTSYPGKYFNLAIYSGGTSSGFIVERFSDLSLLATDPSYAPTVINASSNYVVATDPNAANHTAALFATTNTPLTTALVSQTATSTGALGASTLVNLLNTSSSIHAGMNVSGSGITSGTTISSYGVAAVIIAQTVSYSAPNITLSTASNHNIAVGATVVVSGVTPIGYNGTWTAQAGTSGTTLIINVGSNPGAITGLGTVTSNTAVLSASMTVPASTALTFTNVALTGASDGTTVGNTTVASVSSTAKLDAVNQPILLNAPGVTEATNVNALLTYAYNRGDVFVLIDPTQATLDVTSQLTLANSYTGGAAGAAALGYGAVYYPNLTIPNPTSSAQGSIATAYPGGAIAAKYATTDSSRGVFKSPAGLEARLSGVVAVTPLTNNELDYLNNGTSNPNTFATATPVNAIRYIPGSGIVVMGARTLSSTYQNRYVSVRRSLIYLRKVLTDSTAFALFESNDERLWNRLQTTCEAILINFWQSGGLKGATALDAFYVKADSSINTVSSIAAGEVHLEIGVALQRPAEFVVIRISQYDSGSVVTVL